MSIDRYPGPRSFESNEQSIFRGRTSEIKDLIDLIRLEQVVVLFSKSGLGKSSLLNAGIGPILPNFNYQPIRVRFQLFNHQSATNSDTSNSTPLRITIEYIISEYNTAYHILQKNLSFWEAEMAQLTDGNEEQLANQEAELERVIHQQLESLSTEHPLTDKKLAEFKQKQYEITNHYLLTDANKRVELNNKIETARTALSSTTLLLNDSKESIYSPLTTIDPFGEKVEGRLWETVKLYPFPNGVTPVFFFDQFEEFFAASSEVQRDFLTQLAELLGDQPPSRISERISQELSSANYKLLAEPDQQNYKARMAELTSWGQQPLVKCLFAIRDDRLAEIDSLESFIPTVLKNRYKLNPLTGSNARLAIVEPAVAIGNFTIPPFSYADQNALNDDSANTLQLIINGLSNNKGEIDSTQLQMVCNNIEAAVEKARRVAPDKVTFESNDSGPSLRVDQRLIPDAQTIKMFINEFYTTRLRMVGSPGDADLAGSVLENYFVLNGKRIGVDEPALKQYLSGNELLIDKLVKSRLIRPEPTNRGIAYELSHDKLVEPVEKAKKYREEKNIRNRRLKRFVLISLIATVVLSIAVFYSFWYKYKLDKNQLLLNKIVDYTALIQYNSGKQYLAYRLWQAINDNSERLFAPYAGKDIQVDTLKRFVVTVSGNNELEVRKRRKLSPDTVVYRTNASGFYLAGSTLATYLGVLDNTGGYNVKIINLSSNNSILNISMRAINLSSVTLSSDGHYLVLVDVNYNAHLYSLLNQSENENSNFFEWIKKDEISLRTRKRKIIFNSLSNWLYILDDDYHAYVYDLINNRKFSISTKQRNNKVAAINFTPDGSKLAVVEGQYLAIYDLNKSNESKGQLYRSHYIPLREEFWIVTKNNFMSNDRCIIQDGSRVLIIYPFEENRSQYLIRARLAGKNYILIKENDQFLLKNTSKDEIKIVKFNTSFKDIDFFSPDGKDDTHLIAVYLDHVSVIDLKTNKTDIFHSKGHRFGRLTLTGNLFKIQLGERSDLDDQNRPIANNADYLGFFIDMQKNQINYMNQYVYPRLTTNEREQFGLSK